jgi:hypothetical protein
MDCQITVRDLIAQLLECPPEALVDVRTDGGRDEFDFKIAEDMNLEVTVTPWGSWVTLRGFGL